MSKTIEEQVEEIQRLEEMCDDDSDQIVAMYRRNLRTALQERDRMAREEERGRILNELPKLRQTSYKGEVLISQEAIKGAIDDWKQYIPVYHP